MKVLFRADADPKMGTGHLMRCLALAQALQKLGSTCVFLTGTSMESLRARLTRARIPIHSSVDPFVDVGDAHQTAALAAAEKADWVICDGYHFTEKWQKSFSEKKPKSAKLLCIDDLGTGKFTCDAVLNHSLHALALEYDVPSGTKVLAGSHFALIREEFLKAARHDRQAAPLGEKVLVTLGGGDTRKTTESLVEAIEVLREKPSVKTATGKSEDMPDLMLWADVAVSGGGGTSWEMAYMGLPNLIVPVADNQLPIARALASEGCSIDLGPWHDTDIVAIAESVRALLRDQRRRGDMIARGQALVDGHGAERVARFLESTLKKSLTASLRPAADDDADLIWYWANEAQTRRMSFSGGPIPWTDHLRWWRSKINDPDFACWILLESPGNPAGYVRFDRRGNSAVVSVAVAAPYRGLGLGSAGLDLAVAQAAKRWDLDSVAAHVKTDNEASIKAFRNAGFKNEKSCSEHNGICTTLSRGVLTKA